MKRCAKKIITTACGSVVAASATSVSITAAGSRPNIILIYVDDMGWGDLSCYPKGAAWGDDAYVSTPNIDSIAAAGVRCTDGYASGMVCSPSRAGLLTGRYQQKFGFYGFAETMAPIPDIPLLPEVLKDAGYRTGMIGKWHVSFVDGSHPLDRGFDRFFGFIGGQHDYFEADLGQPLHTVEFAWDGYILDQTQRVEKVKYLTNEFTDRTVDFLQSAATDSRPFFLYLAYNTPHPSMQVHWEDLEPYAAKRANGRFTSRDIAKAMIEVLDRDVGQILQLLKDTGMDENTLIIFSSDNGGADDGPGRVTQHNGGLRCRKGYFYEGGIRVPFIVKWPKKIPAGVVYQQPVSQLDIFATALAAAGVPEKKYPASLDGVNLVPYLIDEKKDAPHEFLFWSLANKQVKWAARSGKWKLINDDTQSFPLPAGGGSPNFQLQLYDLENDPFETKNLLSEEPAVAAQMLAAMQKFHASMTPSICTPAITAALNAELKERANHPELIGWPRADGAPGHWIGAGAKVRDDAEKARGN